MMQCIFNKEDHTIPTETASGRKNYTENQLYAAQQEAPI
jgi:hypothetical protein